MNETNHDAILKKVSTLFERMNQNRQLQELAENNGIDIKNSIKLTDDNMMNVAVTLVALSLAKEANDPRYKTLVNTGLQKRSLKMEIVNDYKSQANNIIHDWKSGVTVVQSSEPQTPVEPVSDEDDIQQEGFFDNAEENHNKALKCETLDDCEKAFNISFPEDFKNGYDALYKKIGNNVIRCTVNGIPREGTLSHPSNMVFFSDKRMKHMVQIFNMDVDWITINLKNGKYYLNAFNEIDKYDEGTVVFENFNEFKNFMISKDRKIETRNEDEIASEKGFWSIPKHKTFEYLEKKYSVKFPESFKKYYPEIYNKYYGNDPNWRNHEPFKFNYDGKSYYGRVYNESGLDSEMKFYSDEFDDLAIPILYYILPTEYGEITNDVFLDFKTGKYFDGEDMKETSSGKVTFKSVKPRFDNFNEFMKFLGFKNSDE